MLLKQLTGYLAATVGSQGDMTLCCIQFSILFLFNQSIYSRHVTPDRKHKTSTMLLDMDAELQHLINISMDKMTSGASSDLTGRGSRKSRAMDLRKALLVAHVLQEVRCAYLDEDYQIVANTLTDIHSKKYAKDHETEYEYSTVKEVNERCIQESLYLREDDIKSVPQTSPTVLQSCMTNSDVMVSRIAQVTRPMAVSINTNHVVSYQSLDHPTEDDSDPIVCEELEVSSCCEVVSSDEILPHDSETDEYVDVVNVSWTQEAPKVPEAPSSPKPSCPLPRKKRPLPKEFLDSSPSKICRTNNCDVTSTTTSYTPTTSTSSVGLESRTSVSVTTVCSSMGTTNSISSSMTTQCPVLTSSVSERPKVVVQMTQSCDTYLPITCTRLYFNAKLAELTSLQQTAVV